METGPMVFVRLGHERASIYWEGGIGFEKYMPGIGWIVDDEPSGPMADYAVVMRNYHCRKHLKPIGAGDFMDDEPVAVVSQEVADAFGLTPVAGLVEVWTVDEILAREG